MSGLLYKIVASEFSFFSWSESCSNLLNGVAKQFCFSCDAVILAQNNLSVFSNFRHIFRHFLVKTSTKTLNKTF